MSTIDATLPASDGVAYFNRMYREVTRLVADAVRDNEFLAAEFLERLDVNFANLFFTAYADAAGRTSGDTRMGTALRGAGTGLTRHPIQFALAGMNAHISHDLAFAVVATCREIGVVPVDESAEHLDFSRTNAVLAEASAVVKGWFLIRAGRRARRDRRQARRRHRDVRHPRRPRAAAWQTSEILWVLEDNPRMDQLFRSGLSRSVELTSRGILL